MQGNTTEQVHKGGQVNVSNQGGNPVPKDSVAERTKQPLTDFSELGLDMMQDMQEEIKAMEKQLKDKKAALAMAEAKGPEEQDDLSSVSSTDVLVGGQASTFDFSFLPNFLEQELSTPSLPLRGKSRRADLLLGANMFDDDEYERLPEPTGNDLKLTGNDLKQSSPTTSAPPLVGGNPITDPRLQKLLATLKALEAKEEKTVTEAPLPEGGQEFEAPLPEGGQEFANAMAQVEKHRNRTVDPPKLKNLRALTLAESPNDDLADILIGALTADQVQQAMGGSNQKLVHAMMDLLAQKAPVSNAHTVEIVHADSMQQKGLPPQDFSQSLKNSSIYERAVAQTNMEDKCIRTVLDSKIPVASPHNEPLRAAAKRGERTSPTTMSMETIVYFKSLGKTKSRESAKSDWTNVKRMKILGSASKLAPVLRSILEKFCIAKAEMAQYD